jgi:hypothetical protein
MDRSLALEDEVRAWLGRLSALTDAARMMSGRIVIESVERKGPRRSGVTCYCSRLELTTIDEELVVDSHVEGNAAQEDVYGAIRNSFRLLRHQLVVETERLKSAPDADPTAAGPPAV